MPVPETRPNISGLMITRSLPEPSGYNAGEADLEGRILRSSNRCLRQLPNGEVVSFVREVWYRNAEARAQLNAYARWRSANSRTEESIARRRLQSRAKQRPDLVEPGHEELLESRKLRSPLHTVPEGAIRPLTPTPRKLGERGDQSRPWLFDPEFRPAWLAFLRSGRTQTDINLIRPLAEAALSRWWKSLPAGHRTAPRRFDPSQSSSTKMWPASWGVDPVRVPEATPELLAKLLRRGDEPLRKFPSNMSLFGMSSKVPELSKWVLALGIDAFCGQVSKWIAEGRIAGRQIPGTNPGSFSWELEY